MTLGRREHDFEEKPGGWRECQACGRELAPGVDALPLCPGPREERSELERGAGPSPVSDRKTEKRSSSVTGELLVNTEACGWVVRQGRCYLARAPFDHTCSGAPGRADIEPAHVEPRIRGYGDWIVREGEVELNVVGACPRAHDLLDGQINDGPGWRQFYRDMARDEAARLTGECPIEPPEHYRMKADGRLV